MVERHELVLKHTHPMVRDHVVHNRALLPGLAYIDLIFHYARSAFDVEIQDVRLRRLAIHRPMMIHVGAQIHLKINFEEIAGGWAVSVTGFEGDSGRHGSARIRFVTAELHRDRVQFDERIEVEPFVRAAQDIVSLDSLYAAASARGMTHRNAVKARGRVCIQPDSCLIDVELPPAPESEGPGYLFHPTLIDGAAMAASAFAVPGAGMDEALYLPLYYDAFAATHPIQSSCFATVKRSTLSAVQEICKMDLHFFDRSGRKVGELTGLTGKRVRDAHQFAAPQVESTQEPEVQTKGMKMGEADTRSPASGDSRQQSSASVEATLRSIFAKFLEQPAGSIDVNAGFFELGLESSQLLELLQEMERAFGRTMNPTLLFEKSNLAELIVHLAEEQQSIANPPGPSVPDSGSEAAPSVPENRTSGRFDYSFSGAEPFLRDHRVFGQAALMGITHPCLVIESILQQDHGKFPVELTKIRFLGGPVTADPTVTIDATVNLENQAGTERFHTTCEKNRVGPGLPCCEGTVAVGSTVAEPADLDLDSILQSATKLGPDTIQSWYGRTKEFYLGPTLQVFADAWQLQNKTLVSRVELAGKAAKGTVTSLALDPLLLGAAYFGIEAGDGEKETAGSIFVPFMIERLTLYRQASETAYVVTIPRTQKADFAAFDALILDEDGSCIAAIENASVKQVGDPAKLTNAEFGSSARDVSISESNGTTGRDSGAEDIAIIGMSGRFPQAYDLKSFWDNLRDGKNCITEIPQDRWDWRAYHSEDRSEAGRTFSKWGGFIEDVDRFDALFFSISPREAERMDPQERLFLEQCWTALEDAGYTRQRLQNAQPPYLAGQVGVYVGVMSQEYALHAAGATALGENMGLGTGISSIAARVSYFCNFHGPSLAVDTMCSSSLTSIHLACEALRQGRVDAALAGGVNISIHPNKYLVLSQGQFISSKGRCESFGEGGDGYIPGEGVGAVFLKRLADAERDGDSIYAVIKGSAINHGGKASGYTVPNPNAQEMVIRRAIDDAKIDPRTISYLEAHGTGTKLGDPIEIRALSNAFAIGTQDRQFCRIGSVKSNIGHCEAAAGIAGVAKVVLQLQHRKLVPSLHSRTLNPNIEFETTPFEVNQSLRDWERPVVAGRETPRRAGISSFGASGANAHVILEEYIPKARSESGPEAGAGGAYLVPLSAKSDERLREYARRMLAFLSERSAVSPGHAEAGARPDSRPALAGMLADILSVEPDTLDSTMSFDEYNLDGLQLSALHNRIVEQFGLDLDPSGIRECRSLDELARTIESGLHGSARSRSAESNSEASASLKPKHVDLRDLAYTLQTGREQLGHRVAFIAKDTASLIAQLEAYCNEREHESTFLSRRSQELRDFVQRFRTDEDLSSAAQKWLTRGHHAKLAELWVSGYDIDWSSLYGDARPRRLGLPTYPFARERYWVPVSDSAPAPAAGGVSHLHPLVHENTSDLSSQQYRTRFTGTEFYLRDHVVGADKVLPGVAVLEMARAAGELSSHLVVTGLDQVVWSRPVTVNGQPRDVVLSLYPEPDGLAFETHGDDDSGELVHSRGRLVVGEGFPARPDALDVATVRSRCGEAVEGAALYRGFADRGIRYGAGFQGLVSLWHNGDESLAAIRVPSGAGTDDKGFALHPGMLDAALQTTAGLSLSGGPDGLALPFAVESVRLFAPTPASGYAYARLSDGSSLSDRVVKYDIDVTDDNGAVCVTLRGFSTRRVNAAALGSGPSPELVYAAPAWEPQPVPGPNEPASSNPVILLVSGLSSAKRSSLSRQLPDAELVALPAVPARDPGGAAAAVFHAAFEQVRKVLAIKTGPRPHVIALLDDGLSSFVHASLSGLFRTAGLEQPAFRGRVVRIADLGKLGARRLADLVGREQQGEEGAVDVRYSANDAREVRIVEERSVEPSSSPVVHSGGVYWITGGLGGLGLAFAREFCKTPDVTVVLSGRTAPTGTQEQMLADFANNGSRAVWLGCDVTDSASVEAAVTGISKEHGQLTGVVHSAGVLRDGFILKQDRASLDAVLGPKILGARHLDSATAGIELDFFVLFSSGSGLFGNAGQAAYAGANAFLDGFAAYRNDLVGSGKRHGRTVSIGWPLWQDGGMQMPSSSVQQLRARFGVSPLPTDLGLAAFADVLDSGQSQVAVLCGDAQKLRSRVLGAGNEQGGIGASATNPDSDRQSAAIASSEKAADADSNGTSDPKGTSTELLTEKTAQYLKRELSGVLKLPSRRIDSNAALEDYGIDSVMVTALTDRLEERFGALSKTLFFEYQTVSELAGYFVSSHREQLISLLGLERNEEHYSNGTASAKADANGAPDDLNEEFPILARRSRPRFAPTGATQNGSQSPDAPLDIAIVGVAGRYPGAADVDAFWSNLRSGRDCITEIPRDRWDHRQYFDPDRNKPGGVYSKWGGFIDDVDKFDPLFFGITPREAAGMDPQERLFLECAWATLEDAGYTRAGLAGLTGSGLPGSVGVYVGVMYQEYQLYGAQASLLGDPVSLSGNAANIANRVSYFCNFHGPSLAVDTMCSSSLTTIHLACQSLVHGQCDAALAGGVNVSVHPNKYIGLSQGQFVSSQGRCESFGKGGDGYVPGEGVGCVLLKPLAKAISDGDRIYGVIKGTSVNHGGKTNGYTVPNPHAQANVIGRALSQSGVPADAVSYIEAHGTGTSLGDPIEISGLAEAYGKLTSNRGFCAIGSAKSNIGHCESAAGIAGVTKVLLQLQHGEIAPSLHAEVLNPNIDFEQTPFVVQTKLGDWSRPVVGSEGNERPYPRTAGISSFGAGGSNAHVIVQEYVAPSDAASRSSSPVIVDSAHPAVVPLSAKGETQLRLRAEQLAEWLRTQDAVSDLSADDAQTNGAAASDSDTEPAAGDTAALLADLAYTLQVGREPMSHRAVFIAADTATLLDALDSFAAGETEVEGVYAGGSGGSGELVRLFSSDRALADAVRSWISDGRYDKLAELWVSGVDVDWQDLYPDSRPRRLRLPTYPFLRERYWAADDLFVQAQAVTGGAGALHPLIDANVSTFRSQVFGKRLRPDAFYLRDHVIGGRCLLPGVAYVEMARAAGTLAEQAPVTVVRDVIWGRPIEVGSAALDVEIALVPDGSSVLCTVSDGADADAAVYCRSRVEYGSVGEPRQVDVTALMSRLGPAREKADIYADFAEYGFAYGPSFRVTETLYSGPTEALGRLVLEDGAADGDGWVLHPSLLDGALRVLGGVEALSASGSEGGVQVPFGLERLEIFSELTSPCWVYASVDADADAAGGVSGGRISILSDSGVEQVRITGLSVKALAGTDGEGQSTAAAGAGEPANQPAAAAMEAELKEPVAASISSLAAAPTTAQTYSDATAAPEQESATVTDVADVALEPGPTTAPTTTSPTLYYQPHWQPAQASGSRKSDTVLLFADDASSASMLSSALPDSATVVLVTQGDSFSKISDTHYVIDASNASDYSQLLTSLADQGYGKADVAFLWPLSSPALAVTRKSRVPVGQLETNLAAGFYPLVRLLQSATSLGHEHRLRCVYGYAADADQARPDQELVGGLARALTTVNHRFELVTVALPSAVATDPDALGALLAAEFAADDSGSGTQVSFRDGVRQVRRLAPVAQDALESGTDVDIRPGGVYLLSGGAGGLGLIFARWLCETHGARVVLLGRSRLAGEKQAAVTALDRETPGSVAYVRGDVTRLADVRRAVRTAVRRFGPVDGVLHIAGLAGEIGIAEASVPDLEAILRVKLHGALHLDRATADQPLSLFALFSSIASHVGDFGVGSYAAANRFLDSFSRLRSSLVASGSRHGQTVSIGWPYWQEGGFGSAGRVEAGSDAAGEVYFNYSGMRGLTTDAGIRAFETACGLGLPEVVVASGEQSRIERILLGAGVKRAANGTAAPAPQSPPEQTSQPPANGDAGHSRTTTRTAAPANTASTDPLFAQMETYLKERLSEITDLPARRIDSGQELESYGIDSVMIMELNSVLSRDFSSLRSTLFFEYRTIAALAGYFVREHGTELTALFGAPEQAAGSNGSAAAGGQDTANGSAVANGSTAGPALAHRFTTARSRDGGGARVSGRQAIAVVGLGGRYPKARTLDEFWDNLKSGRDCITEVPSERWDHSEYFDPERGKEGRSYSKWGGFIDDVDRFDPLFFNISPREAELMDPQDRLFLETVWETMEDGGFPKSELRGKSVGVFVGTMYNYYPFLAEDRRGRELLAFMTSWSIANRVSYYFGFQGPSLALNTACSSSLTAVHMACESIRRGECEYAIAGGVNLSIHPAKWLALSYQSMIGSDCRSKPLGDGDGFVPGGGVGAALLKPLDAALRDEDRIYGVIRGGFINHGGKTNGFTVPNPDAQADLVRRALEQADVSPEQIGYIETATNGSALGDPIEIASLTNVFGSGARDASIPIGTVKSNIGHLEAASGISQLVKVLLQLKHGQLVPSINTEPLNPNIDLDQTPFHIQKMLDDWAVPSGAQNEAGGADPRRALISSFGAGGSNAHLVIEEFAEKRERRVAPADSHLIVFSATDRPALVRLLQKWASYLETSEADQFLVEDVAFTLQTGREPLADRIALVVSSLAELRERISLCIESPRLEGLEDKLIFAGNTETSGRDEFNRIVAARAQDHLVNQSLNARALDELAVYWVNGIVVPWRSLYGTHLPQRIALPTYPFARERYWVPEAQAAASDPERPTAEAIVSVSSGNDAQAAADEDPYRYVVRFLETELGVAEDRIRSDGHLQDHGMDSISGMRLMRGIEEQYGVKLTGREMLEHTTPRKLAGFVSKKIRSETAPPDDSVAVQSVDQQETANSESEEAVMLEKFKRGEISLDEIKEIV